MINRNYEAKPTARQSATEKLPAGAYEAKIKSARVETTSWGVDRLVIAYDISVGEYAGFFQKDFDGNQNEDKKWRGTYRINIPNGDGTEKDGWRQKAFNSFIWALEDSNAGYSFDWDETKLKGKAIGVNYRNKEWKINGRSGWTTECGQCESITDVRNGKCRKLADRPLQNKEQTQLPPMAPIAGADDDLPF